MDEVLPDARGSKLMPYKGDFSYSFSCNYPGRDEVVLHFTRKSSSLAKVGGGESYKKEKVKSWNFVSNVTADTPHSWALPSFCFFIEVLPWL